MKSTLNASGFRFVIGIGDLGHARDQWAQLALELALHDGFEGSLHAATAIYTPINDLERLADRLTKYVSDSHANPDGEDGFEEFVPLDLGLRVMAADGSVAGDGTDGQLTISVHLDVGKWGNRVYVGAEGLVAFSEVILFADGLRHLARHLVEVAK